MKIKNIFVLLIAFFSIGFFNACSNLDNQNHSIVIQLPKSNNRAISESTKNKFIDSLSYYVYLTGEIEEIKEDETDIKEEADINTAIDEYLNIFEEELQSILVAKKNGKAGQTIHFDNLDDGTYYVFLLYYSDIFKKCGVTAQKVIIKNGNSEEVAFKLELPELTENDVTEEPIEPTEPTIPTVTPDFTGYTEISTGTELLNFLTKIDESTEDNYTNEATWGKAYLSDNIYIEQGISFESENGLSALIDLNNYTIKYNGSQDDNFFHFGKNVNITIKNGTLTSSAEMNTEFIKTTEQTIDNSQQAANIVFDNITIENIVMSENYSASIICQRGGTFKIINSSIKNTNSSGSTIMADDGATFIQNSTIEASCSILNIGTVTGGTVYVVDSELVSSNNGSANNLKEGSLIIAGSTLTHTDSSKLCISTQPTTTLVVCDRYLDNNNEYKTTEKATTVGSIKVCGTDNNSARVFLGGNAKVSEIQTEDYVDFYQVKGNTTPTSAFTKISYNGNSWKSIRLFKNNNGSPYELEENFNLEIFPIKQVSTSIFSEWKEIQGNPYYELSQVTN